MKRAKLFSGLLLALWCALCLPAWAQRTTGAISGVVTDETGARVPNAEITLTDEERGRTYAATTQPDGTYSFPLLPHGRYTLEAQASGFQTYVRRGIILLVDQELTIDFSLTIGKVTEKVQVVGGPPLVDTVSGSLGRVVEEQRIEELPLNGRNFLQLSVLQPGVVPSTGLNLTASDKASKDPALSSFSVNGLRGQANRFFLDGVDNTNPSLNNALSIPAPDALAEFKVLTNVYSAEFGNGGGSIVNVVTKSGTNEIHGSIYNYLRNDNLDARGFFAQEKEALIRNQFGGSLGGPIVKDRTFAFGSYEGFREKRGTTLSTTVPSLLERQGDFSESPVQPIDFFTGLPFPGDQIPAARLDPVAQNVLALIPLPNAGERTFTSSPSVNTDRDHFLLRIDHQITERDDFFGRYFFENIDIQDPFPVSFAGPISVPGFGEKITGRFQHLVLRENHIFSPRTLNEFRFGYSRAKLIRGIPTSELNPADFGFTFPQPIPTDKFPTVAITGFTNLGFIDASSKGVTNLFEFQDHFTTGFRGHRLKFGAQVRHIRNNRFADLLTHGAYLFAGAFTGNPFADYLLGQPFLFFQGGGIGDRAWRKTTYEFYAQDTFRITRTLTLNYGIRYIVAPVFSEKRDREFNVIPGAGQSIVRPDAPPGLFFPGDPGFPEDGVYETDINNIAPRFSFAYDPFGDGKTSIRGGFGIFYDDPAGINILDIFHPDPRFFQVFGRIGAVSMANPFGGNPFSPLDPSGGFASIPPFQLGRAFEPSFDTPYVYQYHLTLQRSLGQDFLLQTSYVGTKATKLLGVKEGNPAVFIPGASSPFNVDARRPLAPGFSQIFLSSGEYNSNYNALQVMLEKRFSQGYYVQASYTFSKALDDISVQNQFIGINGQPSMPANPNDIEAERGLAAFDRTHRFVFNFLWQLPFFRDRKDFLGAVAGGWEIAGIGTFQSGAPFTVIDSSDPNLDGVTTDRPDLVGDPEAGPSTLSEWFNTSAFQPVPFGTNRFGTAGRNILRGDGLAQFDFSILRRIPIRSVSESFAVEFRAEFFNLFNHPDFAVPQNDITSPDFGRVINTISTPREIQFVLKLLF